MHFWKALVFLLTPEPHAAIQILNDWREDAFDFLRNQAPRILAILIVAFVLARLLKVVSQHVSNLSTRQVLPSAVRTQQLRTLSSVIYSVGATPDISGSMGRISPRPDILGV